MDATTLRALQDKVYDKRKHAAFLLEAQIKDHLAKNEFEKLDQVLAQLSALALNPNASSRWGGVMGLAACSIALGSEIPNYLFHIVPPIISCFSDPDSKVRYFSCESMYNVTKVAKGEILVYFNDLFDTLSKLAADPDPAVKNGAELLDRLLKDIVTEQAATYVSVVPPRPHDYLRSLTSSSTSTFSTPLPAHHLDLSTSSARSQLHIERAFSLEHFIPLLHERIYNYNPFTRQYLVSWLQLLNSIPELNLVSYLPEFLDGLIKYLTDSGSEIQVAVQHLLADLLVEIDKVVHANEYKARKQMHQKQLSEHRQTFERRMEELHLDRRLSPLDAQPPILLTESPNTSSQSSLLNPTPTATHDEGVVVSSPQSRADTIMPNNENDTLNATPKPNLNDAFEDPEDNDSVDAELGTYVQGQGVELDLAAIVDILVGWMCHHESCEETEATCLRWLNELMHIDQSILIPFTPQLIPIILSNLSLHRPHIRELAAEVNANLSRAIEDLPTPTPLNGHTTPAALSSDAAQVKREKSKPDRSRTANSQQAYEKTRSKASKIDRGSHVIATALSSWNARQRRHQHPSKPISEEGLSVDGILPLNRETGPSEDQPVLDPFDYSLTVNALTLQFLNEREETRLAALSWLIMLHNKVPDRILSLNDGTFPALLKTLSDESEAVIKSDLQLLSQISLRSLGGEQDGFYYGHFMWNLLSLFGTDRNLLELRGNLIVRVLCQYLNPERIYESFAGYLEKDEDLEFASSMVQNLNMIMITSPELSEMRKKLKTLETKDSIQLFIHLYRSFSHNPVSTLTLCLLSPLAYEHAFNLLTILANDMEITVNLLIQVDKLVQLLESPVFTSLRLQLLEPDKYPFLYKALYGILMLLPQSSAFATLRNRLGAVSTLGYAHAIPKAPTVTTNSTTGSSLNINNLRPNKNAGKANEPTESIPWNSLLLHFKAVQTRHENLRRQQNNHLISGRDDVSRGLMDESLTPSPVEPTPYSATGSSRTQTNLSPAASLSTTPLPNTSPSQSIPPTNIFTSLQPVSGGAPSPTSILGVHHRFASTSSASHPAAAQPSKIPASMIGHHMRKKSHASMNTVSGGTGGGLHTTRKPSTMSGSTPPAPSKSSIERPGPSIAPKR